jgi:4-aminobutyrate aminotransferase-like enzyme
MVTKRTTRTEELVKKHAAHYFQGLSRPGSAPNIIWEKAEGSTVWDSDGNKYVDMTSGGVHCVNLGFNRKEINDAICEQTKRISYIHSGTGWSNVQVIEYTAELAKVLPSDLNHVAVTCSGSESVEVAIQIARMYWDGLGETGKYKVLCLDRAYHGGTALTRSLTGSHIGSFDRAHPGIVRVPYYHCRNCPFNLKYPSCDIACARYLEQVIKQEGEGTVSCFIAEVAQGNGGVVWPPDEYWPIVRKICSEHNVLLIGDEVQTGFCRTGKFFCLEHYNVVPDLMTMAKGINASYLPFGAVGISDKICNALPKDKMFMGYTTSGANSVACASARAALKLYQEEKLAERAARLGAHLRKRLVEEFLTLPCIDDVLGKGLYQSFEINLSKTTGKPYNAEATMKARDTLCAKCLEEGIIMGGVDGYPMRQPIVPPLIVTEEELNRALDVSLSIVKEFKPV